MHHDGRGRAAVLAGVALDIEHQAAENRILGPGGTHGNLSLLGHTLPLILPGQPLLWLLPSGCLRTRDAVFRVTEDGAREGLVGHDT